MSTARACYDRAVQTAPLHRLLQVLLEYANVEGRFGDQRLAIKHYESAVQQYPKDQRSVHIVGTTSVGGERRGISLCNFIAFIFSTVLFGRSWDEYLRFLYNRRGRVESGVEAQAVENVLRRRSSEIGPSRTPSNTAVVTPSSRSDGALLDDIDNESYELEENAYFSGTSTSLMEGSEEEEQNEYSVGFEEPLSFSVPSADRPTSALSIDGGDSDEGADEYEYPSLALFGPGLR